MRLLLDTHVFLATANLGSVTLPGPMLSLLADDTSRLHVSVASLWEIAIKVRTGKLQFGIKLDDLEALCAAASATVVPITARHALAVVAPEPHTRDPFDRLLLAQAIVEGMQLVTLDRALVGHPAAWQPV